MNKIRMIQSEEKSHCKLSQMEERSWKAWRHETISDEIETISTRPRLRPNPETRDLKFWSQDRDHVSRPNIPAYLSA